jgi:hypothetical protein
MSVEYPVPKGTELLVLAHTISYWEQVLSVLEQVSKVL